ncbi:hypothetical protein RHGRI_035635 [Rhododendron griersonianum]|uniref:C2H2-type domain-containing protein n=1 Tax=Rhododendron griersonianum TaxID=479676 RepID=A0AAV6HND6_9ERIC|nr:hypothetical protein RHGRI_035635 [Rhododendron griersonianum]
MSGEVDDHGSFFSSDNNNNYTGEGQGEEEEELQKLPEKQLVQKRVGGSSSRPTSTNGNGSTSQPQPAAKKKRNLPGNPDPTAEVIVLSPTTLMATNRFVCEICNKGFQRDQNLQLHRRGHNLPWKLRQRTTTEVRKRVYVCPEPACVHHNPARALGDLTGIKKHFSRKHGEKKWKCDKCSKKYAVQSDWKAHQKTCGTREYKCDCGTIFSRRDSFITHRAFCDALAEENNKANQRGGLAPSMGSNIQAQLPDQLMSPVPVTTNSPMGFLDFNTNYDSKTPLKSLPQELLPVPFKPANMAGDMFSTTSGSLFGGPRGIINSSTPSGLQLISPNNSPSGFNYDSKNGSPLSSGSAHMSATALLQKAAQMGATASNSNINSPRIQKNFINSGSSSYGAMEHHNNSSFDQPFQSHRNQSKLIGINGGGFINPLLQKGPQEMSHFFNTGTDENEMDLFGGMLVGGYPQSQGLFMKNPEQEDNDSSSLSRGRAPVSWNAITRSTLGGSVSGDNMTTVDFMGVGGSSRPPNLHQQQQQKSLELEALMGSQQRIQIMNSQFDEQLFQGEPVMEKPIWDA